MNTLIINANNLKDLALIEELAKRLKLSVKLIKEEKSPYNPEFVKMINEAEKSKKRYEIKDVENLWENL